MLDYKPLNAEQKELRLLYFLQNKDTLASSASDEYPEGIIRIEMNTVSLDDYTNESREFMASTGSMTYQMKDYLDRQVSADMKFQPNQSVSERLARMKLAEDSAEQMISSPSYGRWKWGDYKTLSYVWGETKASRHIIVNGTQIAVMENLEDFLRNYVLSVSPSSGVERTGIWVDALCINQNDVDERSIEVKRMGDIYKNASGTVAWLGKAANESDKAMNLLELLSEQQFNSNEEAAIGLENIIESNQLKPGSWKALEDLLLRPYWKRLWIIQEIVLSGDRLNFMCGDCFLSWPLLFGAICALSLASGAIEKAIQQDFEDIGLERCAEFAFLPAISLIRQFGIFMAAKSSSAFSDLNNLFEIVQGAGQKDPRDKIYGILSLIDQKLSDLIVPDYSKSAEAIFADFTKNVIISSKRLDIVARWGEQKSEKRQFPSWVTDLTADPVVSLELTSNAPYSADKNSEAIFKFEHDVLIAKGYIIDNVDGLGPGYSDFKEDDWSLDLVQPLRTNRHYQNDDDMRNALWKTLVADRNEIGEVAPDSYKNLLEIPWDDSLTWDDSFSDPFLGIFDFLRDYNKEFQLGGRDFRSYFPSSDAPTIDQKNPLWQIRQEFSRRMRVIAGRRLMTTNNGYVGLAAISAQQGDVICILLGCAVPIILRPTIDKKSYEVVGESYVHGFMNGEAMEELKAGKYSLEDFRIC